ncbi:MAG TPA: glycosyltransferase family 2 protein [Chloroflexia bacterium]|nr:glycosyltransferase family 2 protein [Chloroflexia bacterium]
MNQPPEAPRASAHLPVPDPSTLVPSPASGIPQDYLISVVMPVYNEPRTIRQIVEQVEAVPLNKEIIAVDDCSTDGTGAILEDLAREGRIRLFKHRVNQGKGAAVRTGLANVKGDIVIIQDADLEYDPSEYPLLIGPILKGRSKAVYGSRFLGPHKAMYFWHQVGNKGLTLVTNILFDTTLTDMETCYKVFTADIARKLDIKSERWGIDPEITAKILRMGVRIYETPISYTGREMWEGKKISWRDGIAVVGTLLRYRFFK